MGVDTFKRFGQIRLFFFSNAALLHTVAVMTLQSPPENTTAKIINPDQAQLSTNSQPAGCSCACRTLPTKRGGVPNLGVFSRRHYRLQSEAGWCNASVAELSHDNCLVLFHL